MNARPIKILISVIVFCFYLLLAGGSENNGGNNYSEYKPVYEAAIDALALFSNHPIAKGLKFLKIIFNANEAMEKNSESVSFNTINPKVTGELNVNSSNDGYATFHTPTEDIMFSPAEFMKVNNFQVGDEIAFQQIDAKIQKDYTECTDEALNTGEGNHIRLLELRLNCFQRRGYDPVNQDYMKIKYETYYGI